MSEDWARLAEAIKRGRKEKRWTQEQLAEAAGVGYSTVQRLESGKPFGRRPPTLLPVARALGWDDGSVSSVLAGGNPTPRPDEASVAGTSAVTRDLARYHLPARVEHALSEGELVDTEVIELPGGLTLVVIGKSDVPRSAEDEREMGDVVKAWTRAQRKIRGIAADEA